jgi:ribosome-binding protein aMBF1 (putative translation factor)
MNIKCNDINVNPEFEDLLSFKSENEKIEHMAQMISFRILSEVEKLCEEKKISKKELAAKVGTSGSYITQLFNGTKSVNTSIMAKLENALDIKFEFNLFQTPNQ